MTKRLNLLFPYFVLAVVVGAVALSNMPSGEPSPNPPVTSELLCSGCGMPVGGEPVVSTGGEGGEVYFCTPRCRERFQRVGHRTAPAGVRTVDVVCNMEVNPKWGITSRYKGRSYYFCVERCKERFDADPERYLVTRCPVCEVPVDGRPTYSATYLGHTYSLCSSEHREEFKQDPAAFFMHTMWGIPSWLYYASIAIVLVVSFGVFELLSRGRRGVAAKPGDTGSGGRRAAPQNRKNPHTETSTLPRRFGPDDIRGEAERLSVRAGGRSGGGATAVAVPQSVVPLAAGGPACRSAHAAAAASERFDLLSIGWIRRALGSRVFRFGCQAVVVALFALIIAAGLFGNQNPALNIAPILTWTVWWGALIILILFAGKAWCYVCPWDAVAGWTEKLALWCKVDDGLSLRLKWPRVVRNISIATLLFVGLTWIELGFGVTMKPRVTAYLAIAMLLLAVASALLFDRKSFCRYGCLVGRVSGLYALFSGVEVRPRDRKICSHCRTKECVQGNATAYGCPTYLYPGKLETNTYCIQCMECIQACPRDNLALNLRPWGSDLAIEGKPRTDEAYLALLMLSITGFHGLTMTPVWQQLIDGLRGGTGAGRVLAFSLAMGLLMLGPILIYALLAWAALQLSRRQAPKTLTYRDFFIRYAYALLPIALFYHIAHNLEHLLMEGPKVVAMVSDPFGWGWNLLGTGRSVIPPLVSLDKLWLIQVFLVLVGHVYSLWVAQKTSLRLFGSAKAAFRSQLPMLAGMICFSVFSLWLLKQPMEMRTSAM